MSAVGPENTAVQRTNQVIPNLLDNLFILKQMLSNCSATYGAPGAGPDYDIGGPMPKGHGMPRLLPLSLIHI